MRLPEFFSELGAFDSLGFGAHWRLCVRTVPCLRGVLFKKVALIKGVAVELLWLVQVSGHVATVDGDHKTPRVHCFERQKRTDMKVMLRDKVCPAGPDTHC